MNAKISEELKAVARQHRGKLRPKDVVDFAKDPKTALHARFEWDNSAAAAEYRLWQARELIRVAVVIIPNKNTPMNVRAYWSLPSQRGKTGGYITSVKVMKDPALRAELLAMAREDMVRFRTKYAGIAQLAKVIDAMNQAEIALLSSPVAKSA